MIQQCIYPAIVKRDEGGYFLVTFPDFPEAGTDGESLAEALTGAVDCLAEAVAGRIARAEPLPFPSRSHKSQHRIVLPAQLAAKAALCWAMTARGLSHAALAQVLDCSARDVRRLLDPRQPAELCRIEQAITAIGQELVVALQTSAGR